MLACLHVMLCLLLRLILFQLLVSMVASVDSLRSVNICWCCCFCCVTVCFHPENFYIYACAMYFAHNNSAYIYICIAIELLLYGAFLQFLEISWNRSRSSPIQGLWWNSRRMVQMWGRGKSARLSLVRRRNFVRNSLHSISSKSIQQVSALETT